MLAAAWLAAWRLDSTAVMLTLAGVQVLASYAAALAAERARQREGLDPLTGLPRRTALIERLEAEILRAEREGQPVSVVFCDLDNFKRCNDTYGHKAGDEALRKAAGVLRACLRKYDLAARYGGEELVAVLAAADQPGAMAIADRIRQGIEAEAGYGVTASIGVATYPMDGVDAGELIQAADKAMYAAKQAGKNRVFHAGQAAALTRPRLDELLRILRGASSA